MTRQGNHGHGLEAHPPGRGPNSMGVSTGACGFACQCPGMPIKKPAQELEEYHPGSRALQLRRSGFHQVCKSSNNRLARCWQGSLFREMFADMISTYRTQGILCMLVCLQMLGPPKWWQSRFVILGDLGLKDATSVQRCQK